MMLTRKDNDTQHTTGFAEPRNGRIMAMGLTDCGVVVEGSQAIGGGCCSRPPPEGNALDNVSGVDAGLNNAVDQLVVIHLLCCCLSLARG